MYLKFFDEVKRRPEKLGFCGRNPPIHETLSAGDAEIAGFSSNLRSVEVIQGGKNSRPLVSRRIDFLSDRECDILPRRSTG